jgi:hypothetical protein
VEIDEQRVKEGLAPRSGVVVARDLAWMLAPSSVGVTRDAVTPALKPKAKAKVVVVESDEEEGGGEDLTEEMRSDLESQGASSVAQLARLSVSLHVGRKASEGFCTGACYGEPHTQAEGVRKAAKVKQYGSNKPILEVLDEAMRDGDLAPVERCITRITDAFLSDQGDKFFVTAASRVMQVWAKAKSIESVEEHPQIAAFYMFMLLDSTPGRGVPTIVDQELMRQARREAVKVCDGGASDRPAAKRAQTGGDPTKALADRAGRPVVGEAACPLLTAVESLVAETGKLRSDQRELMQEVGRMRTQSTEAAAAVGKLRGAQNEFRDQIDSVRRKAKEPGEGGGDRGGGRGESRFCFNCNQKGHLASDCPRPRKGREAGGVEIEEIEA